MLKVLKNQGGIILIELALWLSLITLAVFGSGIELYYNVAPCLCLLSILFVIKRHLRLSSLMRLFVFFCIITFISSYNFFFHFKNSHNYINYFSYSILGYVVAIGAYCFVNGHDDRMKIIYYFYCIFLLIGIFRFARSTTQVAEFMQNNAFYYVLTPLPILLYGTKKQFLQIILLSIVSLVCIISMKRSALIGVGLIWLLFIIFSVSKNKNKKKNIKYIFIIIFFLLFIIQYLDSKLNLSFYIDRVSTRMQNIENDGGSGRIDIIDSFFKDDISDLLSFPNLIIGNGFEGYLNKTHGLLTSLHNDFLEVFYSLGLLGLGSLIYFYILLLKNSLSIDNEYSSLKLAYSSLLLLFILYSMVGSNFNYFFNSLPLFLGLGALESIRKRKKLRIREVINL